MKQVNIQYAWLLLGALALLPRTVVAQDKVTSETPREADVVSIPTDSAVVEAPKESAFTYPKSYSVRPLTMQKGMIRANGIFDF